MGLQTKLSWDIAQNQWASVLNPVIGSPTNNISIISTSLKNGTNVINHKLGKKMQGWFIVDQDAAAQIYRSQPLNDLTLTLTSNAAVNVALGVF